MSPPHLVMFHKEKHAEYEVSPSWCWPGHGIHGMPLEFPGSHGHSEMAPFWVPKIWMVKSPYVRTHPSWLKSSYFCILNSSFECQITRFWNVCILSSCCTVRSWPTKFRWFQKNATPRKVRRRKMLSRPDLQFSVTEMGDFYNISQYINRLYHIIIIIIIKCFKLIPIW